ncbi:unannotated protein [freshwater metagenome]|uniref:phosphoglycerate dehydrogenase n=1 Tax=freshwater metagenome TaxID=449393 RepID=A0A6J7FV78_9ZZZZ|nr:phosphoglycerate dehydrogenase [Actinomycetota bacterium]
MALRVLIAEEIAPSGIDALREAGFTVDERLGLSPDELLDAVVGADALVIRSSTQVTEAVLNAGADLTVVGRAGIGLDNVDVEAATARGVMVVNAPQSNVISAAEHTVALLLAQARNIPQANADLKNGAWNRSHWTGVELHGKTLAVVGLGRVGVLVAQRLLAFGMQIIAYDPYVSAERARQLGIRLIDNLEEVIQHADFLTVHLPKTPETMGLFDASLLAHAKANLRIVNTARGGIIDEAALAAAISEGRIAGAAIDVFATEPTTDSPLFALPSVVVTPHLGASTVEAQDKAGQTIAEQLVLALRGEFVPFAVNVAATQANATVAPFLPLAERLGRLLVALADGDLVSIEVVCEGEIGDYDCGVLTLGALKGALKGAGEETASFVNAPQLAEKRGLEVTQSATATAGDFVNLITVRGVSGTKTGGQIVNVSGTLLGKHAGARIVGINYHSVDLPPADYMLVVRNDDTPGMIGTVGTTLGAAGVNIADMDVGTNIAGEAALMVLATYGSVPEAAVKELRATKGVLEVHAISLA